MQMNLTDKELVYAATVRCRCGAGLAHPLDHKLAMELMAWVCSRVLSGAEPEPEHDHLPFAFYKVREETSINNVGTHHRTTRPAGTIALTVGKATCPKCSHEWQSAPYNACGLGHHWFPGPCPGCAYAIGGAGTYRSGEGQPIATRYSDIVLDAT